MDVVGLSKDALVLRSRRSSPRGKSPCAIKGTSSLCNHICKGSPGLGFKTQLRKSSAFLPHIHSSPGNRKLNNALGCSSFGCIFPLFFPDCRFPVFSLFCLTFGSPSLLLLASHKNSVGLFRVLVRFYTVGKEPNKSLSKHLRVPNIKLLKSARSVGSYCASGEKTVGTT